MEEMVHVYGAPPRTYWFSYLCFYGLYALLPTNVICCTLFAGDWISALRGDPNSVSSIYSGSDYILIAMFVWMHYLSLLGLALIIVSGTHSAEGARNFLVLAILAALVGPIMFLNVLPGSVLPITGSFLTVGDTGAAAIEYGYMIES
jgi:hypothetical protein